MDTTAERTISTEASPNVVSRFKAQSNTLSRKSNKPFSIWKIITINKLRNIKIGDKVIVGKGGSSDRIAEVGFASDTQIQVNGLRYNFLDGRLVGAEEGEKYRIMPATDKEIKRVRRNERKLELIRKVNNTNWYGLSIKTLNTIIEIVDKEFQGNFNKGNVLNLEN